MHAPQIRDEEGAQVALVPFPHQLDLWRAWDAGGPMLIVKARQVGISTGIMAAVAHDLAHGKSTLVISRKQDVAQHLATIGKLLYETVVYEGKPVVVRSNLQELVVEGGARVIVETATQSAGRGYTVQRLVLDEFAHMPWQEEIWTSAMPTAAKHGNVCVLSTPNGQGDLFEQLYTRHADPERADQAGEITRAGSDWRVFRLPYTVDPTRDTRWVDKQLQGSNRRTFSQEYECCFLASGEAVFPPEVIAQCVELGRVITARPPGRVILGVDVAGEGRDESVVTILETTTGPYQELEQTAWEQIGSPALQHEIEKRYRQYEASEVAVDYTGIGWGVAQNLDVPYTAVTFTGGGEVQGAGTDKQRVPRDKLLNNALQLMEQGRVALNPQNAELRRALETARWEKARGEFVDRLDSWLLALWMAGEIGSRGYATAESVILGSINW